MDSIARTGTWGKARARGIVRTVPKEVWNPAIDRQRPSTLLDAKAKWVTGTIKLCSKDFLMIMVPKE